MLKLEFRPGQLIKHSATLGDDYGLIISVWETEHLEHLEFQSAWVTRLEVAFLWPDGLAVLKGASLFFQNTFPIIQQTPK